MKEALRTIAFSREEPSRAILALLEVALEALDASGHNLAAVYVEMGLKTYCAQIASPDADQQPCVGKGDASIL